MQVNHYLLCALNDVIRMFGKFLSRDRDCIQKFRLEGAITTEPPEKLSDHDLKNNIERWVSSYLVSK